MNIDTVSLLEKAKQGLDEVDNGDEFLVKDLFLGFQWKKLPKNTRIQIGKLFLDYAKNDDNIQIINKTTSNQQLYKKVTSI